MGIPNITYTLFHLPKGTWPFSLKMCLILLLCFAFASISIAFNYLRIYSLRKIGFSEYICHFGFIFKFGPYFACVLYLCFKSMPMSSVCNCNAFQTTNWLLCGHIHYIHQRPHSDSPQIAILFNNYSLVHWKLISDAKF